MKVQNRKRDLFLAAGAVLTLSVMPGCAAGRADDGAIILGARLADFPETAEQAAKFAAGALGEPWSSLAKAAIGLLFGSGAAAIAARRAKQREDQAWDEAEARAYSRHRDAAHNKI